MSAGTLIEETPGEIGYISRKAPGNYAAACRRVDAEHSICRTLEAVGKDPAFYVAEVKPGLTVGPFMRCASADEARSVAERTWFLAMGYDLLA